MEVLTVVLDRHQNEWEIVGAGRFHVPLGVGHFRRPICEIDAELVTRDNDDTYVDLAADQSLTKVNDIDHKEIASRRDLDLDTNTHARAIDGMALRPVDLPALCLGPGLTELFVYQPPQGRTAVRIPLLLD